MFVTVEGIDGAGKSTLVSALEDRYPDAAFTREPTGSWLGDCVERSISDEDSSPFTDLFLFTADHSDHLERVVRPAVEAGDLLFCDRYVDSRIAYQGATLQGRVNRPMEYVRRIHEPWSITPDLTLLLDLPVEQALTRLDMRMKYENESQLRDVRENYRTLAEQEPERFRVVEAGASPQEVVEACVEAVEAEL